VLQRPLAALSDPALVSAAKAGRREAFSELVRRHSSAVRALLRRMGCEPATADDLAQDALVIAYERLAEFRGDGAFAGWLKRIAARLYLKRVRGRLRLETPIDDLDEPAEEGPDPGLRLDLDQALRQLPDAERLCVSLCHGAGFSHPEIAESLNLPLGTVKSHVTRGLARLRRSLAADLGVEEK
jgi:RNA polymerase sigma-70 factor (ECF subfamily)